MPESNRSKKSLVLKSLLKNPYEHYRTNVLAFRKIAACYVVSQSNQKENSLVMVITDHEASECADEINQGK